MFSLAGHMTMELNLDNAGSCNRDEHSSIESVISSTANCERHLYLLVDKGNIHIDLRHFYIKKKITLELM